MGLIYTASTAIVNALERWHARRRPDPIGDELVHRMGALVKGAPRPRVLDNAQARNQQSLPHSPTHTEDIR